MNTVTIINAGIDHVMPVTRLFDAYRVFYAQESDPEAAHTFVEQRLHEQDSVILLALDENDGTPLGFAQLYPSYSSVSMKRLWILNDLYVDGHARRRGVARALMERARQHAVDTDAKGLVLETAVDNLPAQNLYEDCGWVKDEEFFRYGFDIR